MFDALEERSLMEALAKSGAACVTAAMSALMS